MISLDVAHKLVQEQLNISDSEYTITHFSEKGFLLTGKGFKFGVTDLWINEFRITQYPFENLYFGLDFLAQVCTEEHFIYMLNRIKNYIGAFKKNINKNLDVML